MGLLGFFHDAAVVCNPIGRGPGEKLRLQSKGRERESIGHGGKLMEIETTLMGNHWGECARKLAI
jgi:hypothetical protein